MHNRVDSASTQRPEGEGSSLKSTPISTLTKQHAAASWGEVSKDMQVAIVSKAQFLPQSAAHINKTGTTETEDLRKETRAPGFGNGDRFEDYSVADFPDAGLPSFFEPPKIYALDEDSNDVILNDQVEFKIVQVKDPLNFGARPP